MPELVTHALFGWLTARALLRWLGRLDLLAVAVGACLPDWVSHLFVLYPPAFEALSLLHEPLPLLLCCALGATFVAAQQRLWTFVSLALGATTHYLLDLFQAHAFDTIRPLFPFSFETVGVHLYPIEGSVWVAPLLVVACAAIALRDRRDRRRAREA